jgi:hypothetical protein
MSLFCFESICVEKVASMLFKTMFIIMSIILITNLYATTSACVDNTISFGVFLVLSQTYRMHIIFPKSAIFRYNYAATA